MSTADSLAHALDRRLGTLERLEVRAFTRAFVAAKV
jgi:hypothetical protein